nr:helix-turn-helix domain-containing protein [Rhizobium sp. Q54]
MLTNNDLTPEEARRDHLEMLRFLAVNALFGIGLGIAIAAALWWFNLYGLGTHIGRSRTPLLSFVMVAVPLALTFGGAVTASAIMLMPYKRKKQL